MTSPNWGLAQGGGFQNALTTGLQFGQMVRQRQDEKEYKNALMQYNPDDPETLKPIMAARPEVGLKLRDEVQARQSERQTAELTQRAIRGDAEAMKQLATVNFDRWKALDTNQRAAATQEAELFGNAAMDILNRPPEQRMAAVQQYAQQFGQQYPEIGQIASLPPEQLEGVLRGAIAEAGMVKQLDEMLRPRYQAIPEGGTLVDTSSPQAVQSYMGGMGAGAAPQVKQIGGKSYFQDANGDWYEDDGGATQGGSPTFREAFGN